MYISYCETEYYVFQYNVKKCCLETIFLVQRRVTLVHRLQCCTGNIVAQVTLLHRLHCCTGYIVATVTLLHRLHCWTVTLLHMLHCCTGYIVAQVTLLHRSHCALATLAVQRTSDFSAVMLKLI